MDINLDINNLIRKTEELVHGPRMEMAAKGTVVIQEFTDDRGIKFQLQVTLTCIEEELIIQ